jgi:hypothetical protein
MIESLILTDVIGSVLIDGDVMTSTSVFSLFSFRKFARIQSFITRVVVLMVFMSVSLDD